VYDFILFYCGLTPSVPLSRGERGKFKAPPTPGEVPIAIGMGRGQFRKDLFRR